MQSQLNRNAVAALKSEGWITYVRVVDRRVSDNDSIFFFSSSAPHHKHASHKTPGCTVQS